MRLHVPISAAILFAVFAGRDASAGPRPALLIISGGGNPADNAINHLDNVRWVESLWSGVGPVWSLVADGLDATPDAAQLAPGGPDTLDYWLQTLVYGDGPPLSFVDSTATSIVGPATRAGLERWVREAGATLPPGSDLTVYVTDHGTRGDDVSRIVLWGEDLDPGQLASILLKLPAHVTVRLLLTQCYGGGFVDTVAALLKAGRSACGLFAAPPDRVASGCRVDPASDGYREYTTSFFAALFGRARLEGAGPAVAATWSAAHLNAVDRLTTVDVPIMSRGWLKPATALRADATDARIDALIASLPERSDVPVELRRRAEQAAAKVHELEDEIAADWLERHPWLLHPTVAANAPLIARSRQVLAAALKTDPRFAALRDADAAWGRADAALYGAEIAAARAARRAELVATRGGERGRGRIDAAAALRLRQCEDAPAPGQATLP